MKLKHIGLLVLSVTTVIFFQNCGADVAPSDYGQSSTGTPTTPAITVPPAITTKSSDQTISTGANIGLTVNVTGEAVEYQWYKNGASVAGANTNLLNITNATTADSGAYLLYAENEAGNVSTTINLTVSPAVDTSPPIITAAQSDHKVLFTRAGYNPLNLTLTVGTAKATSLQWYFQKAGTTGFVPIVGATTATYSFKTTNTTFGIYKLVATNAYGSVSDDSLVYY